MYFETHFSIQYTLIATLIGYLVFLLLENPANCSKMVAGSSWFKLVISWL